MKKLLRLFKILSFSLFAVLMLVVAAGICLIQWPQLLINDGNLTRAAGFARKAGVDVHWDSAHIQVESLAFLRKRVSLDLKGVCVKMKANQLDACFEQAQVTAAVNLAGFKPKLTELGPIRLAGGRIFAKIDEEAANSTPPKDSRSTASSGFAMPQFLAGTRVLPLQIGLDQVELRNGSTDLKGRLQVKSELGSEGQAQVTAQVEAEAREEAKTPNRVKADLKMINPQGYWALDSWKIGANASGSLADGTVLRVKAQVDPQGHGEKLNFGYQVDASYTKGNGHANVKATGTANPDHIDAHLAGSALQLVPALNRVWVHDCDVSLARRASELEPGAVKIGCPIGMDIPLPPKGFPNIKVPTKVGMRLDADLKTGAFPPTAASSVNGTLAVELAPILTPLFEGHGKVDTVVNGFPAEFPQGLKMDTNLGLQLKIPHFEQLVQKLKNTPWDIWAPLRVLHGSLAVDVKGKFDSNSGTAPLKVTTRLDSDTQKLNIDAQGELQLAQLKPSPAAHLNMDVVLSEIQLELPPLPKLPSVSSAKPDELPRFFPDGRIHSPVRHFEKKSKSFLTYDVSVHTPDEAHPVKLLTKDAKTPIPLSVKLALNDASSPTGAIKVLQFPIELFKRNVTLDHLTLNLKTPADNSELNGAIIVPYTDYTITILLLGTTAKPEVRFMSDPPLAEDQIYATLIFGQPLDALDPDQRKSVGDSRAALREGALSLFSLYYLSSLNIESVDYDPATKTASLKYRLGEGTTLNVSEGGGQSTFGIRKRLTKHLSVTTALNNPSTGQTDRTVSTFLEWAYQY